MRTRTALAFLASATTVLTLLTAPTATAAAQSCYGAARTFDAGYEDDGDTYRAPGRDVSDSADRSDGAGNKYYVASSFCRDVNLYIHNYGGTPYLYAQVCYPNVGCESPHRFNQGDHNWRVIQPGVADGTPFYIKFDYNLHRFSGSVAY